MSTIHVGIRHDYYLVISKLLYIKIIMNTRSKCSDHCFDLRILKDVVYTGLLYVEDLTSKRKDGLSSTVSRSFCGATSRISLDYIDLALVRILA